MKDRLKKLRKVLNLKQREVAERLGINVGTVGQWESGVAVPGDARIYQLCKEYNVRREWLEHGEGEMFEPDPDPYGRKAQRQFCRNIFDSLPKDIQEAFLDVMRERVATEQTERHH